MRYIIPLLFIAVFAVAICKRVKIFSSFSRGAENALAFTASLLPLLVCVFIMCELFEQSHLSDALASFLSPAFGFLGVPEELSKLVLIKPFSGSGSLSFLTDIISEYGADSYIARCACVLYGSSETTFYISAVYFSACRDKKRYLAVVIILFSTLLSTVISCMLCRIM